MPACKPSLLPGLGIREVGIPLVFIIVSPVHGSRLHRGPRAQDRAGQSGPWRASARSLSGLGVTHDSSADCGAECILHCEYVTCIAGGACAVWLQSAVAKLPSKRPVRAAACALVVVRPASRRSYTMRRSREWHWLCASAHNRESTEECDCESCLSRSVTVIAVIGSKSNRCGVQF